MAPALRVVLFAEGSLDPEGARRRHLPCAMCHVPC
jgi:hypothetical protein